MEHTDLNKFYSDRITIYREVSTLDDYGGTSKTWEKKHWNIACRIGDLSGNEEYRIPVEGVERTVTHRLICGKHVDIELGDKIENANYDEIYIVVKIIRVRKFKDIHHLEIHLAMIEGVSVT